MSKTSAFAPEKHKNVDPFLLKKWERVFNIFFDQNASHDVEWGDFYVVTKQVRDIYGAESEQMSYAKETLKALWEGLQKAADTNRDQHISAEEWVHLLEKRTKSAPKWFDDYQKFMFHLFDVSGDQKLDLAEYTDGMAAYGYCQDEAHDAFHKFSVDKKGNPAPAIDLATFKKYWHDYFFSTDPKALGNYLFGMI